MSQYGRFRLERCKYGWMLYENGPWIGQSFTQYGQFSEAEVDVFRYFVRPGDTVIDVGANAGAMTLPLSQLVGPEGRVFAYESLDVWFNVLCGNLALNNVDNVKPMNLFITDDVTVDRSSSWGTDSFVSKRWGPTFGALDDLNLDRCAFIKIDVDGKELQVLRSGATLIRNHRPVIYLENDSREHSAPLIAHLFEQEYDVYWHVAPMFDEENFFGNRQNVWGPNMYVSIMLLALPRERFGDIALKIPKVHSADEWHDGKLNWVRHII